MRETFSSRQVSVDDAQDLFDKGEVVADAIKASPDAPSGARQPVGLAVKEPWVELVLAPDSLQATTAGVDTGTVDESTELLATLRAHYERSLAQLMEAHERELVARDAHARSLLAAYNDAVQARDGQIAALRAQVAEAHAAHETILALVHDRETIIRLREQEAASLRTQLDDLLQHLEAARQEIRALAVEDLHLRDLLYGPPEPRRRASMLICEPESDETQRRRR